MKSRVECNNGSKCLRNTVSLEESQGESKDYLCIYMKTRLRIRKGAREDASRQKMKSLKNKAEWYMSEQVTTTMSKVMTSEGMS